MVKQKRQLEAWWEKCSDKQQLSIKIIEKRRKLKKQLRNEHGKVTYEPLQRRKSLKSCHQILLCFRNQ